MLLAIDIGNTNCVFALYQGDAQLCSWRLQSRAGATKDEYAAILGPLMDRQGLGFDQISAVIISSVVPEVERNLTRFCKIYLASDPIFVTHDVVPLKIDLDQPSQLGADRLVNAYAVNREYDVPAVVIDFGTATTFDVIDGQGTYVGGAICPGINLSIDALSRATAKLPKVPVAKTDRVIGKNTDEAIQGGIFWGYVSLIEGILNRIEAELGSKPSVLATGGLAPLFADHIPAIQTVDETLTLRGLHAIYKEIKSR